MVLCKKDKEKKVFQKNNITSLNISSSCYHHKMFTKKLIYIWKNVPWLVYILCQKLRHNWDDIMINGVKQVVQVSMQRTSATSCVVHLAARTGCHSPNVVAGNSSVTSGHLWWVWVQTVLPPTWPPGHVSALEFVIPHTLSVMPRKADYVWWYNCYQYFSESKPQFARHFPKSQHTALYCPAGYTCPSAPTWIVQNHFTKDCEGLRPSDAIFTKENSSLVYLVLPR